MRIGHGFDVHAFGGEGPIIIGGVRVPYEKGLLAKRLFLYADRKSVV